MLETSFVLIVMLLGEPNPDFAEMRTRGLTEEACQKRAAEYNQGRWGRGWKAYCAVSFTPVKSAPVCAHAACGLLPGRKRV